jgi:hypothetical protein
MQAASSFFLMSAGRPFGASNPPMLSGATSKPLLLHGRHIGDRRIALLGEQAGHHEAAVGRGGQRHHGKFDLPGMRHLDRLGRALERHVVELGLADLRSSAIDRCGMVPSPGLP